MERYKLFDPLLKVVQPLTYVDKEGQPIDSIYLQTPDGDVDLCDYLGQHPEIALLLAANHISFPDPGFLLRLHSHLIDPHGQRNLFVPVSHWYYNLRNNPLYYGMIELGKYVYGYHEQPIVQSYMVNEAVSEITGKEYPPSVAKSLLRQLITEVREWKETEYKTALVLPEGTRSKNRTMQKAEEGVRSFIKHWSPIVVLPCGITYVNDNGSRGPNLFQHPQCIVGDPFLIEDGRGYQVDDLMFKIAALLPEDMRGYYGS
ncbi:hypothetical protein KC726_00030 [Candidatus Woesebacteria bacterium]|nr:hypothetical protein [Candidatus Woesebacteria bacterium]